MELTGKGGMTFASRLYWPEDFAMGCGVMVPVDQMILDEALNAVPPRVRDTLAGVAEDRRFAAGIYRKALATGVMDQGALAEPGEAAAVLSRRA